MQRAVGRTATSLAVVAAVVGPATASLTGCSADDLMASIGLNTSEVSSDQGPAGATPPGATPPGAQPNSLMVTARQRGYLDALAASGVKPSSDLLALSIGSSVCQARAAKQTDQEVWDYVLPLVRNDIRTRGLSAPTPTTADVNSATADYIRIATERLC